MPHRSQTVYKGSTGSLTHNIPFPAGIAAGDRLVLAIMGLGGTGNLVSLDTAFGAWTVLEGPNGITDGNGYLFTKVATGGESGNDIVATYSSSSTTLDAICDAWEASGAAESVGLVNNPTSATVPFDAITPSWGAADTEFQIYALLNRQRTVTAWPTNYTVGQAVTGPNFDPYIAAARRVFQSGITTEDPDDMTLNATARRIGYTVAIEPGVTGPSIGTVDHDAGGSPTDTTLPAGATAQINNADGGTYWAGIWPQASRPTTHAQIVAGTGAVGAVQTGTIPGGGLVTLAEYTGLTASTDYALYVTAEDTGATPVPDGQAGFDDFSTLAPQLVVVIPLVDVETGAPWPDARTILYDLWDAADWHNTGTPQPATEVGSGVTAGGGVLTISTFALAQGTPTFTVMYEEEGTTPGFSPDDYFGVSRQNSVELGLIDTQGAAQYIESPQGSVNWVETTEFLNSKQVMSRTQVAMQTGSTFRLVFDFDVPPDMLALNLWRALGAGPPDNAAQSVVQVDARTLDVTFAKVYDPGRNAVLQFIGVKYGDGSSIPRSTWPRQSP